MHLIEAMSTLTCYFLPDKPPIFRLTNGDNVSEVTCGGILFAPHFNQNFLASEPGFGFLKNKLISRNLLTPVLPWTMIDGLGEDGGAFVFQSDPSVVADGLNGLGINGIQSFGSCYFQIASTK